MNYAQTWVLIERYVLRKECRNFGDIKVAADRFVEVFHSQLSEEEAFEGVFFEECLPTPRIKSRKKIDGEIAADKTGYFDELKKLDINVYNSVYHKTLQSLEKKFTGH